MNQKQEISKMQAGNVTKSSVVCLHFTRWCSAEVWRKKV